jgi:hypothetical protein
MEPDNLAESEAAIEISVINHTNKVKYVIHH